MLTNAKKMLSKKGAVGLLFHYMSLRFIKVIFRNTEIWLDKLLVRLFDHFVFRDRLPSYEKEKELLFSSTIWGSDFMDMHFKTTIPSLLQAGNIPALIERGYKITYFLYTYREDDKYLLSNYSDILRELKKLITFKVFFLEDILDGDSSEDKGPLLQKSFLKSIRYCLDKNAFFFNLCADQLIGNKSILNIVLLAEGKGITVAAAHPRVCRNSIIKFFNESVPFENGKTISNNELLSLAFRFPHSSLTNSFDHIDNNMTNEGLSIRKISKQEYAVVHNLPSPYLIKFNESDYHFFKKRIYNNIDKTWPRKLLKENRLKLLGSNDLFFLIELTKDSAPRNLDKQINNDLYLKRKSRTMWNYFSNSFISTWKGEDYLE